MDQNSDQINKLMLAQFCAQFAFGVPIPQALKVAGYEVHTVGYGYSLLRSEEALAMVEEHRTWIREKLSFTLEQVVQQLDRDREFAYMQENPSAAVIATMNKARLLGYMEKKSAQPKRIIIEWENEEELHQAPQDFPLIEGEIIH